MVVVPEEFRSDEGVSHMKLTGNLVAALRMRGTLDLDVDPEMWTAGLEAALECGQGKGLKFNFVLMHETDLHHYASMLGLMDAVSPNFDRYQIQLPSKSAAKDYLEHFASNPGEKAIYEEMAKSFLEYFENPRKRNEVTIEDNSK